MNNYIDLLRNILKNFDNNEFDSIIKKILSTLFDDYYMNRNKYVWCIDSLYKKYDESRYNYIKKKYRVIKNCKLIYRFNRYSKKSYIIKLLKENFRVILDENETYESVVDIILKKTGIKNYKRYVDNMFMNREIDRDMLEIDLSAKKVCKEVVNNNVVGNDVKEGIFQCKRCFYLPCLNHIPQGNYCSNHNKDMI